MWKKLKAAWNLYRHGKAAQGLLESIGLWKWKWVALVGTSMLSAALMVWSSLKGLPTPLLVAIGLVSFAAFLAIIGFAVVLYRVWREPSDPMSLTANTGPGFLMGGIGMVRNPMGAGISSTLVSFVVSGEPIQVISTSFEPKVMSFEVGEGKQVIVQEAELPKLIRIGSWPSRRTIIVRRFRSNCFEIDGSKAGGLEVRAHLLESARPLEPKG